MTSETLLRRITDFASRADPYPLYAELRKTPVARQEDGVYTVSTYREIHMLLHDPRISSEAGNRIPEAGGAGADSSAAAGLPPTFIRLDPPEHDRLRRIAMRQFGPPHCPRRVDAMRADISRITTGLIDEFDGRGQVDIVDSFAYPLPVTVICSLMGVPREDEPQFQAWADAIVASIETGQAGDVTRQQAGQQARLEMGQYMASLAQRRQHEPRDDMLTGLATDNGPEGKLSPIELITSAVLLFIAGHETTVNLITNGVLTFLRHPEILERLRADPGLIVGAVEELLRYEPPIHLLPQRTPLSDIEIADVTIPRGVPLTLVLAAGNRDPRRFPDPDQFDPGRTDIEHLGFGSGIHSCFGAPLARLEAQIALTELVRRLDNPKLVEDPPPYRPNPVLRGPRHLPVSYDGCLRRDLPH